MKFTGKNVLVTGASRGIGAEIAKSLATFGLKVWVNYRSGEAEANAVKAAIEAEGGSAEVIGFDVSNEEAFTMAKKIAKAEGLLIGISAGANLHAAYAIASRPENKGKTIVTILCDTAERYLSTELFDT